MSQNKEILINNASNESESYLTSMGPAYLNGVLQFSLEEAYFTKKAISFAL
jgi:hypothetical protein